MPNAPEAHDGTGPVWAPDLLVYAPGLPRFPGNTADAVADVIAAEISVQRDGAYRAATSRATAPRGLRVGKSVLGPDDQPVLDVFELDYRERMAQGNATTAGAGAPPGALASFGWSVYALCKLVVAARRPAKSARAKLQLLLGLGATVAIVLATVFAVALQLGLDVGGSPEPEQIGGGAVGGYAALWLAFRKQARLVAEHLRETMRYLHGDRHHNTVTRTLDEAIDGLLDAGWQGRIHVLGYSFGSLVAIDSLLPAGDAPPAGADRIAAAVTSLTTVGCPADAVRLFYPKHFEGRVTRKPGLRWRNVFIPADVFGSNLADDGDAAQAAAADVARTFAGTAPESYRYTTEELSLLNVLVAKGFRMHGGYWGAPGEDSCFTALVDEWVPRPAISLPDVPAQRTARTSRRKVTS